MNGSVEDPLLTQAEEKEEMGLPPPAVLARALKVVTHEVMHAFGMSHCPYFNCVMQGMNHQREYETVFLDVCPVCLHKLIFMTGVAPLLRYKALKEHIDRLIDENGPGYEAIFCKWSEFYQCRIDSVQACGA